MENVMDYTLLRIQVGPAPAKRKHRKIYVCSPLSAPSWLEMNNNMEAARHYVGMVSRLFGCRALATHAYLPLLLDDNVSEERAIALEMGLRLLATCDALIICGKRITAGMSGEITKALELEIPVLFLEDYI